MHSAARIGILPRFGTSLFLAAIIALAACDHSPQSQPVSVSAPPEAPSPHFRNVEAPTAYAGDTACAHCHAAEATAYQQHAMSQSFHRWTPATRLETHLDRPIYNAPTGYSYTIVDAGAQLYQIEFLTGPDGKRVHELRRRVDYVMGSGRVARTYFTEENGRLFQLPLTWYRTHGWDFSPGYEVNNARFDRQMLDRCVGCHASYPRTYPFMDAKYAEVRPGIGCERCHGPGALHVRERTAKAPPDSGFDKTIVNPARLPLERRMDTCEQCHVHTSVAVLREGKTAFSYLPSQPLRDQWAYFKSGNIDIVSHAERLRRSACFIASVNTAQPLECATCHTMHQPTPDSLARNKPCQNCHALALLQQRLARSAALTDHTPRADCVSCHMPKVPERPVHGAFTEHWIRVAGRASTAPATRLPSHGHIEPYFTRDNRGADADVYGGMGEVVYATLANNGRVLGDAAAALDRALGDDTTRTDASFLLGAAYQQLGRSDDAIRVLEPGVRAGSHRPEALRALAQSYERAGHASSDIESLYVRALALQPALAWIRAEYADFLHEEGRRDEAKNAYRTALSEQPSLAVAWFNLATVLKEEGRAAESVHAFQQAIRLDPLLSQALSPLLQIRTEGNTVASAKRLASPLSMLPLREQDAGAIAISIMTGSVVPGIAFANVLAHSVVQILKPDGTLVRALDAEKLGAVRWDFRTESGKLVSGGLYRARILGRDASGRLLPAQFRYVGVVRQHAD